MLLVHCTRFTFTFDQEVFLMIWQSVGLIDKSKREMLSLTELGISFYKMINYRKYSWR